MKLKEDLDNNNDNAGDKNNIQKQVKQKLLQAQQEEALFVKTSAALQSKMEKVEQQLSHSMNGYHLGIHLKKDLERVFYVDFRFDIHLFQKYVFW